MKAFPDFRRMFGLENTVSADSRLSDLSFRLDQDSDSSRGPSESMIHDLLRECSACAGKHRISLTQGGSRLPSPGPD